MGQAGGGWEDGFAPNVAPQPLSPPGWYPDPWGDPAWRWFDGWVWTGYLAPWAVPEASTGHLNPAFPLDQAVADDLSSGVRWGLGQAIWAYVIVFIGGVPLAILQLVGLSQTALILPGELSIGIGVWLVGRRVARERGGWSRAFGVSWPRRSDLRPAAAFIGLQLVARIVIAGVLTALLSGLRHHGASNIPATSGYSAVVVAELVLAVVVVAPVAEETQFRGVILRALMRRWGFQVSAVVCGIAFGLLHALEGNSGASDLTLGLVMTVFGYLQCVLVRRTGRLAPAMIVHGLTNGLAIALALA